MICFNSYLVVQLTDCLRRLNVTSPGKRPSVLLSSPINGMAQPIEVNKGQIQCCDNSSLGFLRISNQKVLDQRGMETPEFLNQDEDKNISLVLLKPYSPILEENLHFKHSCTVVWTYFLTSYQTRLHSCGSHAQVHHCRLHGSETSVWQIFVNSYIFFSFLNQFLFLFQFLK